MNSDNPWKEALLRSSIRHGHKFYEDDPEKSLKEACVALTEMEFQERVDRATTSLNGEIDDLEIENSKLEDQVENLIETLKQIQNIAKESVE